MAERKHIYRVWTNMRSRCTNPRLNRAHRYISRGITWCDRWNSFDNFYEDMGPSYKLGLTLERMDNDLGYFPENCRWATQREQANNRSTNRLFTIDGKTNTFAEWCRIAGIKSNVARQRFYVYNWNIMKSLGIKD